MVRSTGSTPDRVVTAVLLAEAREFEPEITERTLEFWRQEDLLPRPTRTGMNGKKPIWTYPPEAVDQLRTLLRLRTQSKDPAVLRAALWYRGYPVGTGRVRAEIVTFLRHIQTACEAELGELCGDGSGREDRWEAIQAVAKGLANKRNRGFPRLARQTLADRTDAIALTLGLVLGEEQAAVHLEAGAPAVERLIGVEPGRRYRPSGAGPWLDGSPAEGLASFADFANLARLIAAVENSSDDALTAARGLAVTLLGGTSAFSRIADATVGRDNASGMAGMAILGDDLQAPLFTIALILAMQASSQMAQNLMTVVGALETSILPLEQQIRQLAALPNEDLERRLKNIRRLSASEQYALRRALAAFAPDADAQPAQRTAPKGP